MEISDAFAYWNADSPLTRLVFHVAYTEDLPTGFFAIQDFRIPYFIKISCLFATFDGIWWMSANRPLCAVRKPIFSPLICSTRISSVHLPFLISTSNNHAFRQTRTDYHSSAVAHFRNIRLHVGKLPKVPHALKAIAQTSEEHTGPVDCSITHPDAADTSLLQRFQIGRSDEGARKKSFSDALFSRLDPNPSQVTPFISLDEAPQEKSKVAGNDRDSTETCVMPYPTLDSGENYRRAGREQELIVNVEDIVGSGNPVSFQKKSVDMSHKLQAGEPPIVAQYSTPVTSTPQGSGNKNNPAILKIRRNLLNAVRVGDLRNSFKLYLEFSKLAKPDVEVADILIRALCRGTLQAPPRYQILQALQVYNILLAAEQQTAGDVKGFFDSRSRASVSEQRCYTRIYNTLLRALSAPLSMKTSSRDTGGEVQEEYTKLSMDLLSAMEARGLVPDNRTVCSILLLRFRRAANHEEAFELYRTLVTKLEAAHARGLAVFDSDSDSDSSLTSSTQPLLDLRGYRMVLNAFGRLSFPSAPVAPAPLWFAIVKDMRERGHPVTIEDYTIYLGGILAQTTSPFTLHRTAIGFASPQDEEARVEAMMACVKHLHKRLVLDVTIVPDATLMNTLMNAYQHLGAFDDAMKVFNTMWLSNRVDDITPVIVFDACGHARRPREATMIWCKLVEKGWKFDKHTLDTWVECLCRLGNVEAACKFVCVYMGRDKAGYSSKGDTRPDVQTCLVLLKLSWVVGQNLDVKEKIRTHLPHIWKNLTAHYT